jgi:hypothetical protein
MKADEHDPLDVAWLPDPVRRHLIGLGIVAERSARVEEVARELVVLVIDAKRPERLRQALLGERFSSLQGKFSAVVSRMDDDPTLLQKGSGWFKTTRPVMDERDALIHRAVLADFEVDEKRHMLLPARRSHVPEVLRDQAVDLVRKLEVACDDGVDTVSELFSKLRHPSHAERQR